MDGCSLPGVPARNAIILATAVSLAVTQKAEAVITALVKEDGHEYPDADQEFVHLAKMLFKHATRGQVEVLAPFVSKPKSHALQYLIDLDVDPKLTVSCYRPNKSNGSKWMHCGECHACTLRKAAFREIGITDTTTYTEV